MINLRTLTLIWSAVRACICCICSLYLNYLIHILLLTIQILFTRCENDREQSDNTCSQKTLTPLRKHGERKRFIKPINQPMSTPQYLIGKPNDESLPSSSTAPQQPVGKPDIRTKTDSADKHILDAVSKSDCPNITQYHPESETGIVIDADTTPQLLRESQSENNVVSEDIDSNLDQHVNDRTSCDQVAGKGCEPHLLYPPKEPHLLYPPKCDEVGDKSTMDSSNYKRMDLESNRRQSVASKKRKKQRCITLKRDKKYNEFVRNSYELLFEMRNENATNNVRVHVLYGYVLKMDNYQPRREYMHDEWNRFISFGGYRGGRSTFHLARNGFYHFSMNGISYIICHFCHMMLERDDDTNVTHLNCPLFSGNSANIPIHNLNWGNSGICSNREVTIDIREKIVDLGGLPTPALLFGRMVDIHSHGNTRRPNCRVVQRASPNAGGDLVPPLSNRKCIVCHEREAINGRGGNYCCCDECQRECPIC